ncbi:hypothetical protein JCM9279_003531 [Rhodotorula babjevae]
MADSWSSSTSGRDISYLSTFRSKLFASSSSSSRSTRSARLASSRSRQQQTILIEHLSANTAFEHVGNSRARARTSSAQLILLEPIVFLQPALHVSFAGSDSR